jgi:hypothetical protein
MKLPSKYKIDLPDIPIIESHFRDSVVCAACHQYILVEKNNNFTNEKHIYHYAEMIGYDSRSIKRKN